MGFIGTITGIAQEEARKEFAAKAPFLNQSTNDGTGVATVKKYNSDGTIDVSMNGKNFTGVAPPSVPAKLNSPVMLVGGIKAIK